MDIANNDEESNACGKISEAYNGNQETLKNFTENFNATNKMDHRNERIPISNDFNEEVNSSVDNKTQKRVCSIEEEVAQIVGEDFFPEQFETEKVQVNSSSGEDKHTDLDLQITKISCTGGESGNESRDSVQQTSDITVYRENSIDREELENFDDSEDDLDLRNELKNTCENFYRSINDSENSDFGEDYKPNIGDEFILCENDYRETQKPLLNNLVDENTEFPDNISTTIESDSEHQYDISKLMKVKEIRDLHRCSICQYTTTHKNVLRRHIMTKHNPDTTWKCKHCYKKFAAKISVESHIKKEHSKTLRKCPHCSYKLYCYGKVMKKHIARVHNSHKNSIEKNKHNDSKKNPTKRKFECTKCMYSDKNPKKLESHIKLHDLKYVIKCLHCSYMTKNRKCYKLHLNSTHTLAKKVYICSKCFFQCEDRAKYSSHILKFHKPHFCSNCDFKTYYIEELYDHLDNNMDHNKELCMEWNDENLNSANCHRNIQKINSSGNYGDNIEDEQWNGTKEKHCPDSSVVEFYTTRKTSNGLLFECLKCSFNTPVQRYMHKHVSRAHFKKRKEREYMDDDSNQRGSPDSENRRRNRKLIDKRVADYYTTNKKGNDLLFTCLKCAFKSSVKSYIYKHIMKVHLRNSKKNEEISPRENDFENISINGKTSQTKQNSKRLFIIEPISKYSEKEYASSEKVLQLACQQCNFSTSIYMELLIHKEQEHGVTNFKCPNCHYEALNRLALVTHFQSYSDHKPKILTCPFCKFLSYDQASMKSHVNIEHLDILQKGLTYNEEAISNRDDSALGIDDDATYGLEDDSDTTMDNAFDIQENSIGRSYYCKLCLYNTTILPDMQMHLEKDHMARYLKCPRCFKRVPTDHGEFWNHLNQHCPQCSFSSTNRNTLKSHILTHVPRYKRSNNKKSHNKKGLKQKGDSIEEIRIIIGDDDNTDNSIIVKIDNSIVENEFADDNSDASISEEIKIIFDESSSDSNDGDHSNSETDFEQSSKVQEKCISEISKSEVISYKPIKIFKLIEYQCFDCLKVYKNRCCLIDHRKKVHVLKKTHSCTYCMEVFNNYSQLKSHYYRVHEASYHHHKGPIFKCPLCEFTSIYIKQMKKHVLRSHQRNVVGFRYNFSGEELMGR